MAIVRWSDPLRELAHLQDRINRVFTGSQGLPGDESLMTSGAWVPPVDIYQNGDSAAGIPPCAPCHGAAAAGTDDFPRLAGQHVQYLIKQLRSFQNNMRNVAVMHGVARGLQMGDMEAVATYLQSLGP